MFPIPACPLLMISALDLTPFTHFLPQSHLLWSFHWVCGLTTIQAIWHLLSWCILCFNCYWLFPCFPLFPKVIVPDLSWKFNNIKYLTQNPFQGLSQTFEVLGTLRYQGLSLNFNSLEKCLKEELKVSIPIVPMFEKAKFSGAGLWRKCCGNFKVCFQHSFNILYN